MGRLKESSVKKVKKILNKFEFYYLRTGRHDIYYNEKKKITVPVPTSHGVITKGVIQSLIKQTRIPREEFTD